MNELIKVKVNDHQEQVVSARELHEFLEVNTQYKDWFPRMCEYGFTEGQDFSSILSESTGGRRATDHHVTIEMAKELCMIQRNEKGRQARQYFIAVEKAWNDPEMLMARSLQFANRKLLSYEEKVKSLETKIETDRPKVLFADSVAASKNSILIGELAKILKQNGVDTGANRLFEWMRNNGFLIRRHGTDYNMPTQKAMELGLFEIKETVITHADGHTSISKTPKVSGKGQVYFVEKFVGVRYESAR